MIEVFICDGIRTPIGRYAGNLSSIRTDDLAALPLKALRLRNPDVDWNQLEDVVLGCANQAGEDNRNVARMASLLAGYPLQVPGCTINRLCGSGMNAIAIAANTIGAGAARLMVAGGVESMSRAPMVMAKAETAFSRSAQIFDTTIGWRFVNEAMDRLYGTDSMPETAENVAEQFSINRQDQDKFAHWSQQKAAAAQEDGRLDEEIVAVTIPRRKGEDLVFDRDEHLRNSPLQKLEQLATPFRQGGSITAGNASGINDGAAALLLASGEAAKSYGLAPVARILGSAVVGVEPRIMSIGPAPASAKVLKRVNLAIDDMDVIEFNEAFAAQVLACTRKLGLADDDARINPQGGAIALGHPLGMSGARLVLTAARQLQRNRGRYALCSMCIGVGQGIAMVIERV